MTTNTKLKPPQTSNRNEYRATECAECPPELATERQSGWRQTELVRGSVNSVHSASSARSIHSVYSVHSVVRATLPESMDGWKSSLFKFTRALKFDCGIDGMDMGAIRPHVEQWHAEASAVLVGVPFSEIWGEVLTSWERAKHSAFSDPLTVALEKAQAHGRSPEVPDLIGYEEEDVALAYRLVFWLTLDNPRFFISCRALGERLGIDHTKAWRILRMLEADGIITCLKRGKRPKASRYEWTGTVGPLGVCQFGR